MHQEPQGGGVPGYGPTQELHPSATDQPVQPQQVQAQYAQPQHPQTQYAQPPQVQPTPQQPLGQQAARFAREHLRTPETKEFFKTSEFVLWGLGVFVLLIAAGILDDRLDAVRVWQFITLLSSAYIVSRGIAKAGVARGEPRDSYTQYGTGAGAEIARQVATPETKEFYKTSEFLVWALTTFGLMIAAATVDALDANTLWRYLTWLTVAYIVSRGISKFGTRQDSYRPSTYASTYATQGSAVGGDGPGYQQTGSGMSHTPTPGL